MKCPNQLSSCMPSMRKLKAQLFFPAMVLQWCYLSYTHPFRVQHRISTIGCATTTLHNVLFIIGQRGAYLNTWSKHVYSPSLSYWLRMTNAVRGRFKLEMAFLDNKNWMCGVLLRKRKLLKPLFNLLHVVSKINPHCKHWRRVQENS